ncbi:hypothetical protein NWFMUON74_00450 [Nocardia wallacei]|uniref:Glycerophosphoryl diester phosphodiesterase membrane domain-containing protein n=2 Tax=Nocardia wallacei TaxID=480035 RepID=A0A7G1KD70_9NOCA|nr:hypothetical protein NWFMUON74_00450 [Nocardia wallacei]
MVRLRVGGDARRVATDKLGRVLSAAAEGAGPVPGASAPGAAPGAAHDDRESGEAVPIRPLSFRESLDLPFAAIQARVRLLAGLVGIGYGLAVCAVAAITAAGSVATGGSDAGTAWAAVLSTLGFAWLLRSFTRGVTVAAVLASVHRRPITWRETLRRLGAAAGPLLRYRIMTTLIGLGVVALGTVLILTVLPALAWLGWLRSRRCLSTPVLFEHPMRYRDTIARSKTLAAGAEWRLTGLWLSLRGLLLVLIVPLAGLTLFVAKISGTHRWAAIVLITATALLVAVLAEVMESAADVVAYVDRRCRRDGWDIRIPATDRIRPVDTVTRAVTR